MAKQGNLSSTRLACRLLALVAVVLFAGVYARAQQVQAPPSPASPQGANDGSYIVTFRAGTSQADRAASVRRAGAILRFNYRIVDAVAITGNINALAALQREITVLEIIPDRPVRAFQSPNARPGGGGSGGGTGEVVPEGVKRVGVPTSTSGAGIGVAIVDTGMDLVHADLAEGSASFSAFGDSCQDGNGHGTHVAGIVAALKDNGTGVVGVAPGATPYCVRVLDNAGSGSDATVMAGLDWVFANRTLVTPNIRVVNMSLGRSGSLNDNSALRGSVQALYNAGVAVVVAAGNDSSLEVSDQVPATYPEVIAVASSTAIAGSNAGCRFFPGTIPADTASYFTTDGEFDLATGIGVTISAPGADKEDVSKSCFAKSVGILSLKLGGGTTRMSGTSMASPHVAGIVARIMQTKGLSDVEAIRDEIWLTADREGVAPLDSPTGGYSFDGEREGLAQAP